MIAAAFTALLCLAQAQDSLEPEQVSAIDKVFHRWDRLSSPGCAVAVYQRGQMVYGEGFGAANLEHGAPIQTDSIFRIASTSKQFTAACVLLLELDGELSRSDDVRKWIPELPEYEEPIFVEDLIHHTSGLRDYLELLMWAGYSDEAAVDEGVVLDLVARQRGLNHTPGEAFSYTNTGYFLLSVLVERVSGESLRKFAERRLFEPLGMRHTFFNDDADEVIPSRATGYERGWLNGAFRISETRLELVGDGGVFTSVDDLLLWDQNFYEPKVGGVILVKRMTEPAALRSGEVLEYASGLGVGTWRGQAVVAHGGAFVGFRAEMMRFPEKQTTIVCLSNRADFEPTARCREVAQVLFDDLEEEEPDLEVGRIDPGEDDSIPAREPEACAGRYTSDELGVTWSFRVAGEHLYLEGLWEKPQRIRINKRGVWSGVGGEFRFLMDSEGRVDRFILSGGRARGIEFERARD